MKFSDYFFKNYDFAELKDFVEYYEKYISTVGFPPSILIDTYLASKRAIEDIKSFEMQEYVHE